MWCRTCQQDVPAVASQDDGEVCCVRCHTALSPDAAERERRHVASFGSTDIAQPHFPRRVPTMDLDDWELEEALQHAERLVHRFDELDVTSTPTGETLPFRQRIDSGRPRLPAARHPDKLRGSGSSLLAWSVLSIGMMIFVCGGVLLGWSLATGRTELWNLGMPLTIGSQALLVIGLVLQLEHLWQNNRATRETLHDLDEQLDDLRHATTMLTATKTGAAQSFYAHLAEGASPQLLLADLKGQLDLLASRLDSRR